MDIHGKGALPIAAAFCLIVQAAMAAAGLSPVLSGEMASPESYVRIERALELLATGNWYSTSWSGVAEQANLSLHWTRPMEVLLLAGGLFGSIFVDLDTAIFGFGAILGPILQVATLIVLSWGFRPLLSPAWFLAAAGLIILLPALAQVFMAGRPDHQSLLIFLFATQLAIFLRVLAKASDRQRSFLCGLVGAFAIWVGIEGLMFVIVVNIAYGWYWLTRGVDSLDQSNRYLLGLWLGITVAIGIERPFDDWLTADVDRLSIVHWTLAGCLWMIYFRMKPAARDLDLKGRAVLGLVAAIIPLGIIWVLFPDFFGGLSLSEPAIDLALAEARSHDHIGLNAPLPLFWLQHFAFPLAVLPYLFYRTKNADDLLDREVAAFFLFAITISLIPAFVNPATLAYPIVLGILPWCLMLRSLWEYLSNKSETSVLREPAIALLGGAPILLSLAIGLFGVQHTSQQGCNWSAANRYLMAQTPPGQVILSDIWNGATLTFGSDYQLVSLPIHRSGQALVDHYQFMNTDQPETARDIAEKYNVDLVMICGGAGFGSRQDQAKGPSQVMKHRMVRNAAPDWLTPITLPEQLLRFRLYQVQKKSTKAS